MKKLMIMVFAFGVTMCSYAPAQMLPTQDFRPTQINLPDGTSMSCIKTGTVINCQ